MNLIRLDSADDPRVAPYLRIRERDLVGREGRFIAEGKVVLEVLLTASRFEVESVLLLQNRVQGLVETLKHAPGDLAIYVAGGEVIDAIAGFHLHRGILALGRKREAETMEVLLDGLGVSALVVVLVGIANHDNMGAIFRNAAAFGADAILLDPTCCDPLYRKAIRVSVGAALQIPFAAASSARAIIESLAAHDFAQIALSPQGKTNLRAMSRSDRLALWFGSEGTGLPAAILDRVATARIAMGGRMDSLNVAAASAIALHHFTDRPD